MKHLLLALALATALPMTLGGCDKFKELTGDKSSSKKDSSDDEDDDDDKKKKKKKGGDEKSARAPGSAAPSTPATPAGGSLASAHMPADCEAVITMNLQKLMQSPAMTKEVVPLIEEMIVTPSPKQPATKKVQAFMKEAGLSLKSIHNGAVCVKNIGPAQNQEHWVFAFGGEIKPDSVIPALEKAGVLESGDKVIDIDGRKALAAKQGALGQFPDGVVGLSSTIDMYKAATATSTTASTLYKLDPSHELAFALSDAFVQKKVKEDTKSPEPFKTIKSVSGFVDLASNKAVMRLGTGSPDEAKKLDGLIAMLGPEMAKGQPASSIEGALLRSIKSRTEGNDVLVDVPLPPDTLAKGAEMLAALLRKEKASL